MRGPGDSKVSTLAVLKSFSEEENPNKEPDTNVSEHHLRTPFRDINADKMLLFGDLSPTKNAYFVFSVFKKCSMLPA